MSVAAITPFGMAIKHRLLDMGCSQKWLMERVSEETGLYFDGSYLHKIFTGKLNTPSVVLAICDILDIESPELPKT